MCSAQILPFSQTHQGETGFSRYALTKSKYRYIMDIATDMRIQLPTITPNLQDLLRPMNYTFFTLVAYEVIIYTQIVTVYYSVISFVSLKKVDCKHNMFIISSQIQIFNSG